MTGFGILSMIGAHAHLEELEKEEMYDPTDDMTDEEAFLEFQNNEAESLYFNS